MKKVLSVFSFFIFILILTVYGGDVVAIEDYKWKIRMVASNDIETA